jgi:hypothetical protein
MELTYEILGIRPLLIDKLNNDPISKSYVTWAVITVATGIILAIDCLRWLVRVTRVRHILSILGVS